MKACTLENLACFAHVLGELASLSMRFLTIFTITIVFILAFSIRLLFIIGILINSIDLKRTSCEIK